LTSCRTSWRRPERLAALGFQVDLVSQAPVIVENLQQWAGELVGPLQSLALASIGVLGNILILVILSIYIAVDREAIVAFLYRLVPPGFVTEARLLQTSVSRSFGGFLRGQVVLGIVFGAFTAVVNIVFGLQYAALTTVAAGLLQIIRSSARSCPGSRPWPWPRCSSRRSCCRS
jgi:predicted PurR-regulated permease PerM